MRQKQVGFRVLECTLDPSPNKHESFLGPHIPMGTLCQVTTFPTLPTVRVAPLNYHTPAPVPVNMSTRLLKTNEGFDRKVYDSKERKESSHT